MALRAVYQLRENVRALMQDRGFNQKTVAFVLKMHPTWINKFLLGKRAIPLAKLDGLAELFGVQIFDLFRPGASQATERRKGRERRSGKDRRLSADQRVIAEMNARIPHRPKMRKPPIPDGPVISGSKRKRPTTTINDKPS